MPVTNVVAGEVMKASKVNEIINLLNSVETAASVTFGAGSNQLNLPPLAVTQSLSTTNGSYVKVREFLMGVGGTMTFTFTLKTSNDSGSNAQAIARIYRNGVAVGTERSVSGASGTSGTFSENITFSRGDTIAYYLRTSQGTFTSAEISGLKISTNATPSYDPYIGLNV